MKLLLDGRLIAWQGRWDPDSRVSRPIQWKGIPLRGMLLGGGIRKGNFMIGKEEWKALTRL